MRPTAGYGTYPLGSNLCWHGGVHLIAPWVEGGGTQDIRPPVVAIADGTIVAFKQPTPEQFNNSEHVLKFDDGKWTSDGALVLKHETEIGALGTAPVTVTFYSVYQHLSEISPTVRQRGVNGKLYRKEEIGRAGYIAGVPHLIHFEIVCDDANLERLIGRKTGNLDTSKNGRTDAVFGEIYFKIPKGTLIYEVPNNRRMRDKIDNNAPQTVDATAEALGTAQAIAPMQIKKTEKECFIGLRYAGGEGVAAERADLKVVTYIEDEARPGEYLEYGVVTRQQVNASFAGLTKNTFGYNEAEYALYYRAKEICEEWGSSSPTKPMPSAVLELLKFGRVINTAYHPNPAVPGQTVGDIAATPNWRKIVVPAVSASGQSQNAAQTYAWINLNSPNIKVFSDADFPHWRGWRICDDDPSNDDSRCDSPSIRNVLKKAIAAKFSQTEAQEYPFDWLQKWAVNSDEKVIEYLKRIICIMPSEWNAANAATRWSWLKKKTEENGDPMTEEVFNKLTAFIQALSINAPELDAATRHFNPRAFIEAFRKCLWFNAEEFAQCIPRESQRRDNSGVMLNGTTSIPWDKALTRSQTYYMALNRFFQKFCGHSRHRVIHNIAQMLIETDRYQTLREYGTGTATSGNTRFYTVFYGRGFHQITWPSNYIIYGEWRNVPNHTGTYSDPQRITANSVHYKDMPALHEPTFPQRYPQCHSLHGQPHPQAGQPDPLGQVQPALRPAWCAPSFQWSPRFDPVILVNDYYEAAESSGVFWFSKSFAGKKNLNRVCDLQDPENVHNVAYVSWLVNGGDNGHAERQEFAWFLTNILLDAQYRTGAQQFQILRARNAGIVNGNATFPPNYNAQTNNAMIARVHYVFQRP
jgi:predicted chitinase